MNFKRQIAPLVRLKGDALDRAMAGIGMSFAVAPNLIRRSKTCCSLPPASGWRRTTFAF